MAAHDYIPRTGANAEGRRQRCRRNDNGDDDDDMPESA